MTATTMNPPDRLVSAGVGPGQGQAGIAGLTSHLAAHGPLPVPAGDDPSWRAGMVAAVAESGLLGRGGGGFPSARKWAGVRRSGRRPLVVVNAMEGEPASAKDRVLLSHSPHLVLDGAEVAAAAIGASEIVVCVPAESDRAASAIDAAIGERVRAGGSRCRASVARPPGRYVAGEESALVAWLNTGRSLPSLRIDKSVPLSVGRAPAVVHNAETLAQVALIARYGPQWFRRLGTPEAPGSTLVTVSGAVRFPGVVEVEMGTPIIDVLERSGLDTEPSAVLVGGYGGAWLGPWALTTPFAPGPLAGAGAVQGVGLLIALPHGSCGIAETARIARYMAGQSAGQCGPCVFGLPTLADDLELLWSGRGGSELLGRIEQRAATIDGRGACRHPDGVVRLVRSAMTVFAGDARAHAAGQRCPGYGAPTVLTFPKDVVAPGRSRR